jgi:diphthine-ammonia ligase
MELPIIRRPLTGKSVSTDMNYAFDESDEVEDLYVLLAEVKHAFPEAAGVVSGANQSNYQRLRVENVCARLKLTSFSPLWMMTQDDMLEEILGAQIETVLVRVASAGLGPEHLGSPLSDLKPHLYSLKE